MKKAIVLAAGEGTRMKSKHSKVLAKLLGRELIRYITDAAKDAGVDEIYLIGGKNINDLKDLYEGEDMRFVHQPVGDQYPYGTGYAVSLCKDNIGADDDILIILGDTPLIRGESLKGFLDSHIASKKAATVLTADIDDPTGYGRIVKDGDGNFLEIVEDRDCTPEQKKIKEFNSGMMAVKGEDLLRSIGQLTTDNDQNEMYLTDIFKILREEGKKIGTYKLDDTEEVYGINSRVQLSFAEELLRKRINTFHMENGVELKNPDNITIAPTVEIERDAVIESGAVLLGDTKIGEDVKITGDSRIVDSVIEDGAEIRSSYIESSVVKKGADVGPFAHLRKGSSIGEGVHIGNFVEIKNADLGENTKAGHFIYVGDASVGKDTNVGCGVIFANYDGEKKYRSVVGDRAFIGSNSNLVAPVRVEDDAYIACGSTITDDVKKGSLAIARSRQVNKEGWVERKRKKE